MTMEDKKTGIEQETQQMPVPDANYVNQYGADAAATPATNKKKIAVIAIIAVVLVLAVCGIAYAATNNQATAEAEETSVAEEAATVGKLYAQVNAEGYDAATSTPVQVRVYSGDVKEVLANEDAADDPAALGIYTGDANAPIELAAVTEAGTYTVVVDATPVLADGTLFNTPEAQVIELGSEDATATFDATVMDLATASDEQIAAATAAATEAATTSGDESKASAATSATSNTSSKASSAKSSSSSSNSSNSSATNSSSTNSNSSSSSSSSSTSTSHTHDWDYHEAVTHEETVYTTKTVVVCNVCGAQNIDRSHMEAHALAGEGGSSHNETIKVASGTKTVTDKAAYYSCSCGATKSA